MSREIASIVDSLADLRRSEPPADTADAIAFDPAAHVEHERALIAAMIRSPSGSLADATAEAGELASLLAVGDYLNDLAPQLATALAADLAGLSSGAPVLGLSAPPAMGHG